MVCADKRVGVYQVMRGMMLSLTRAAKTRAMTMAAASTLKLSLEVCGFGDSMGTPAFGLNCEELGQIHETHAAVGCAWVIGLGRKFC